MIYTPYTWIELDLQALAANIASYKKIIGSRILAPVIKSNAYGHGMLEIASFCEQHPGVDWLCVALLSDALTLRNNGITKPILVLSTIDADPMHAVGQNIRFSISDYETAVIINQSARSCGAQLPVHVKIDTGLARLGIDPDHALDIIKKIKLLPHVTVEGIYTHCAESQKEDQSFTTHQINIFRELVYSLQQHGIDFPFIHTANSAATDALDLPWCNIFRVGAGIYGLWPSPVNKLITQQRYPDIHLKPIIQWKTRIMHIKRVEADHTIGYDRTYISTHPMTLAMVPTGYYDGYDFRLANQGKVVVRGHYAPIVGRVSMNITTIDLTDIPGAQVGDEVLLMGNMPYLTPYDIGVMIGNPNVREIVTRINPTIVRIPQQHQSFDCANIVKPKHHKIEHST